MGKDRGNDRRTQFRLNSQSIYDSRVAGGKGGAAIKSLQEGLPLDTNEPVHQSIGMRLTINLHDELYAIAKSLARAEDRTISEAVNELIRRGLKPNQSAKVRTKHGLPVVPCSKNFTSEDVYVTDSEA